ncbi:MAG: type II secretion system F family protein, partial [Methylobacteriaceae bacterium]|nr:type II secretion system F family protein [Methylobacteriaceae bacterium]
ALPVYLFLDAVFVAAGAGILFGVFVGQYVVNTLRQNRLEKFFNDFPNSLDVVVRGVSAGLPLIDCLRVIANDAEEPVRGEMATVLQGTTLGLSLPEAIAKMAERVPLPEISFFSVVISIQSRSGGNLAEALANLSKVIRDRKKIRAKANALAQEAKTMATILGSLPFLIFFANYYLSPSYIEPLYTTTLGRWAVAGCLFWMGLGALIMRKMIRFDI